MSNGFVAALDSTGMVVASEPWLNPSGLLTAWIGSDALWLTTPKQALPAAMKLFTPAMAILVGAKETDRTVDSWTGGSR